VSFVLSLLGAGQGEEQDRDDVHAASWVWYLKPAARSNRRQKNNDEPFDQLA
jgi:hypothetical protein